MERITAQFAQLADTLTPPVDEVATIKDAFQGVQSMVQAMFPQGKVHLFGSTANGLALANTNDIDVCLELSVGGETQEEKAVVVERLGAGLRECGMHDILTLPKARVPVVKFVYPGSNTRVDVTVNNMLALINTHLLRCYTAIDPRLPQLVAVVKHWAKRRGVNDAYRGTLSSYAYVLLCIALLQQRSPPILPVLQQEVPGRKMFVRSAGGWVCRFCDDIPSLRGFGAANTETLGELVCAFFDYWAWRHDYNGAVVSIRLGRTLSKKEKDWTRRVERDRHLVCIEDPFELSHDLGRTVDWQSIRVLRGEFERAARIMSTEQDPIPKLLQPHNDWKGPPPPPLNLNLNNSGPPGPMPGPNGLLGPPQPQQPQLLMRPQQQAPPGPPGQQLGLGGLGLGGAGPLGPGLGGSPGMGPAGQGAPMGNQGLPPGLQGLLNGAGAGGVRPPPGMLPPGMGAGSGNGGPSGPGGPAPGMPQLPGGLGPQLGAGMGPRGPPGMPAPRGPPPGMGPRPLLPGQQQPDGPPGQSLGMGLLGAQGMGSGNQQQGLQGLGGFEGLGGARGSQEDGPGLNLASLTSQLAAIRGQQGGVNIGALANQMGGLGLQTVRSNDGLGGDVVAPPGPMGPNTAPGLATRTSGPSPGQQPPLGGLLAGAGGLGLLGQGGGLGGVLGGSGSMGGSSNAAGGPGAVLGQGNGLGGLSFGNRPPGL